MKSLEEIRKEIQRMVNEMTINEIKERIEQDKPKEENIEVISNDELLYEYIKTSFIEVEEEVNVWKNENLLLVA
mgnify:CR=1 FL=1